MDNNIALLKLFPGISKALVTAILNTKGLKGLIIESYGSGNTTSQNWFIALLNNAIKKGLHIVNVTQCPGGMVNMGQYQSSAQLQKIGVISGKDITTEAAIVKLMYLLGAKIDKEDMKIIFETSLRGEIS